MKLIDSHCHLDGQYSTKSPKELIEDAKINGIEKLITIATDIDSWGHVESLSNEFDCVYHSIGLHPHEASHFKAEQLDIMRTRAVHPKCIAIGELGLDYYYKHSTPKEQEAALLPQLELAKDLKKPIVVHSRDAEADLLPHLIKYAASTIQRPGVIHCFTGSIEFGKACIEAGFYISFSGILTFKTAESLRLACAEFPLERILVETDSPFLAPMPHRGKKCEPSMVKFTALKIAEVKKITLDEVAVQTYKNTIDLFGLNS